VVKIETILRKLKEPTFSELSLQGDFIKMVIRRILDESGYFTYPFGYESFLSQIKDIIQEKNIHSPTTRQIRSCPDLVVYDDKGNDICLLEVKSTNYDPNFDEIPIRWDLNLYKESWPESILVLVIPTWHMFYAAPVKDLKMYTVYYEKKKFKVLEEYINEAHLCLMDFNHFEKVFGRVSTDELYKFKRIVRGIFGIFGQKREDYFEDKPQDPILSELLERRKDLTKDEAFQEYNKKNLISKEKFSEIWKRYGKL